MKHKFLALALLLSTSFQALANGDEGPYNGRQYVVKSINLNEKIKDRLPVLTNGTEVISKIQVQAMGTYFDGRIFDKHNNLRRPKNDEVIDVNDDDGSLTLFAIKRSLASMAEGEGKNRVAFFHRALENSLNIKTPETLEGHIYYPDVPVVRISGHATFINEQPFAGLSADDLPNSSYDVKSIRFNPLIATAENLKNLDWLSEVVVEANSSLVTLKDTDGFLTQSALSAWKKFELDKNESSPESRLIEPCIKVFNSITGDSDPFAVAGKSYSNMAINRPIINKTPLAGINVKNFDTVSPRFVQISNNPVTFFSSRHDQLVHGINFLDIKPLEIDVVEPVSNIVLDELKGGDFSITRDELREGPRISYKYKFHVEKNNPIVLETGAMFERETKHSFDLKRSIQCVEIGDFLAYSTHYNISCLRVSMGPILHENLDKTRKVVADSWSCHASEKATQHFDKLFLDKLKELVENT